MVVSVTELKKSRAALKRSRKPMIAEMQAILTKDAAEDGDSDRFQALEKAVADHDDQIAEHDDRIEQLESFHELAAKNAEEVEPDDDDVSRSIDPAITKTVRKERVPAQAAAPEIKVAPGLRAARYLIGKTYAIKHGDRAAADLISRVYGDDSVAKAVLTVGTVGASTIPVYFSTDLIEYLRAMVVVRNAGAATIDTTGGNLTIPRLSGSATSTWINENVDIPTSNETFDTVILSNHKLATIVAVSNDLVRRSPLGLDTIVRDDLVASIARTEDIAFLTGASGGSSPTGLKNQTGIQSFTAASAALSDVVAGVQGAVTKLQMANTRMIRPAWAMSPMSRNFIAAQRDGVGGFFVYQEEINNRNTLAGYPIFTTTNLPVNLTGYALPSGGTKGSDVFLFDAADVLIGDTLNVQVDVTDVGSYFDGTALQSAFSRDLTLFRIIKETDLVLRHPTSVVQMKVDSWTLY